MLIFGTNYFVIIPCRWALEPHRSFMNDRSVYPEGHRISPVSTHEVYPREKCLGIQSIINSRRQQQPPVTLIFVPYLRVARLSVLKTELHDHGHARPGRCHYKLMQGSYEIDGNRIDVHQGISSSFHVAG
ncbi:unnamed protein product [Fusarium venenatum]|uniref:Uncharacterized protein n=1 Tax=Fusarium venenatum TaxID=56646 RepID=A0A2L2TG66_9HYPO|nr:uncharacterized protein FVRRES_13243 [Fusarium venenatum]CEI40718.1 unnamed protein product [Fusarium venenatum]